MGDSVRYLGQILIHIGAADRSQVMHARSQQIKRHSTKKIGEILCDLRYITREDLHRALSLQQDLDSVD
jgi:hypothetical protein